MFRVRDTDIKWGFTDDQRHSWRSDNAYQQIFVLFLCNIYNSLITCALSAHRIMARLFIRPLNVK